MAEGGRRTLLGCFLLIAYLCSPILGQVCNWGGIRIDCCPGGCSQQTCQQTNKCCWNPITPQGGQADLTNATEEAIIAAQKLQGIPWCFNSNPPIQGYALTKITPTTYGFEATLKNVAGQHPFGTDISPLHLSVYFETETRMRVKIYDMTKPRWEVPNVIKVQPPKNKPSIMDYTFSYTPYPFGFAVTRKSTGDVIFNSTSPSSGSMFNGLIFEDQYLEMSTQLPKDANLYGLGERVHPYRLDNSGKYYTMFATDIATPYNINLYGSHPFYLELRNSSTNPRKVAAHGVFLLNSNGMDIYLGKQLLTYRVIGGILDFYFFLGPSPADVIQQYTEVIGRPYMPPYWALGWHQCRYGYHTLQEVETVVEKYAENKLALDTIWTDIDYMDKYYDFTFDPVRFPLAQVQQFVSTLHSNGQHYIVITDCGLPNDTSYTPWNQGVSMDIFIKDHTGKTPFIGKVWPGFTAWVDWTHPGATTFWTNQIATFLASVPLDGLWIDMNEVSNFCNGACSPPQKNTISILPDLSEEVPAQPASSPSSFNPNNPPYAINNRGSRQPLNQDTIGMDAVHYASLEYNTHNLFGYGEANATALALEKVRNARAVVISRSTFPGHGYRAGHWLGDNDSDWADLYYAIPGILNFQLFGIPLVGADICGFGGSTTEELCARWMQVGVFYPFSRNHNDINSPSQEPYVWPLVANISREVLGIKYSILPYYYTLFHEAHVLGLTVARPLLFEFPDDINTLAIDRQFLIGSGFLLTPVLDQGATSVTGYFPGGSSARWYDYYTRQQLAVPSSGWVTLDAPLTKIPLHLRGGVIIPTQQPSLTTAASRLNPYGLLVALAADGTSSGNLYLDAGDGLDTLTSGKFSYVVFNATRQSLTSTVGKTGWTPVNTIQTIDIMGLPACPTSVSVNGATNGFSASCQPSIKALAIRGVSLPLLKPFAVKWS